MLYFSGRMVQRICLYNEAIFHMHIRRELRSQLRNWFMNMNRFCKEKTENYISWSYDLDFLVFFLRCVTLIWWPEKAAAGVDQLKGVWGHRRLILLSLRVLMTKRCYFQLSRYLLRCNRKWSINKRNAPITVFRLVFAGLSSPLY